MEPANSQLTAQPPDNLIDQIASVPTSKWRVITHSINMSPHTVLETSISVPLSDSHRATYFGRQAIFPSIAGDIGPMFGPTAVYLREVSTPSGNSMEVITRADFLQVAELHKPFFEQQQRRIQELLADIAQAPSKYEWEILSPDQFASSVQDLTVSITKVKISSIFGARTQYSIHGRATDGSSAEWSEEGEVAERIYTQVSDLKEKAAATSTEASVRPQLSQAEREEIRHIAKQFKSIDHVAIAVADLEPAVRTLSILGFLETERREVNGAGSGMKSVVMTAGNVKLVLLQGIGQNSQISRFIERYGTGVHHIAVGVNDLPAVYDKFKSLGLEFQTELVGGDDLIQCFIKRDAGMGIMLELIERGAEPGFKDQNVNALFSQMESREAV